MAAQSTKSSKPKRDKKQERVDAVDARVWSHRVFEASRQRNEAMKSGEIIRDMVSGRSTDELKRQMSSYGDDWVPADWNKMAPLVKVMIPALLHNEPDVQVQPWDDLDETSVRKADLYTYLCRRFIRTNKRIKHTKAALFEAIIYGKGCTFTDYNSAENQPRTRFQTIKNLYIDPNYDGTPETMQWVARDLILPVEVAKKKWPKKAAKIKPSLANLSEGEEGRMEKDDSLDPKRLKDHVQLVEIWIGGKSTEYPDLPLGEAGIPENLTEESQEHTGYHGKREVLTLIRQGERKAMIIDRKPWPAVFDEGEFPFSFLELTNDPGKPFGESILNPVRRAQEIINIMWSAVASRQISSAKDIISLDEAAFENIDAVEKVLRDKKQLAIVRAKRGQNAERALQQVSLGTPSAAQANIMHEAGAMFDEGSSFRELTSGDVRKADNATAAQFSEERRQSSIANAVQEVEFWQADISRKELMVAQSLMSAEDVAEVAPPRLIGEVTEEMDNDGNKVAMYPYWDDNMTPRQIRNESQCFVRQGSMRFMSVEERRDSMAEVKRLHGESLALAGSAGYQLPKQALVADIKMTEHIANLAGISEFKDLKIDADDIEPLEDEAAKQEEAQAQAQQAQQQLAQALPQMIQQVVAPMFAQFGEAMMTKIIEALQLQSAPPPSQVAPAINPIEELMGVR